LTLEAQVRQLEAESVQLKKPKMALTVEEASRETGIGKSAIYLLVYKKWQIPHRRINAVGKKGQGKILIPRAALESEAW